MKQALVIRHLEDELTGGVVLCISTTSQSITKKNKKNDN
jgi:hypothetical protein